jgi:hypothetical protein
MPDPIEEALDGALPHEAAPFAVAEQVEPDQLAAMRAQIDAANNAATEARAHAQAQAQAADEANRRAAEAIQGRFGAQDAAIANALASATNDVATIKAQVSRAQAEGNFDAATEAIDALTDAKIRVKQAEGQKRWLEDEKRKTAAEVAAAEQQRQQYANQPVDPMDGLSPAARQWVQAHPRFLNDQAYQNKARVAAQYAESVLGFAADTPEYYEHVETALGERQAAYDDDPAPRQQTRQRNSTMAAQPSRSASPGHAQSRQSFTLSPIERQYALDTMGELKGQDGQKLSQAEIFKRYATNRDVALRNKPLTPIS